MTSLVPVPNIASRYRIAQYFTLKSIKNRFPRVSSVLGRDAKTYGKQFLFDGCEDTAWNSDQVTGYKIFIYIFLINFNFSSGYSTVDIIEIQQSDNIDRIYHPVPWRLHTKEHLPSKISFHRRRDEAWDSCYMLSRGQQCCAELSSAWANHTYQQPEVAFPREHRLFWQNYSIQIGYFPSLNWQFVNFFKET